MAGSSREKDDAWLMSEGRWENGVIYNQYYLWFHVLEDEIRHRGQIRTIKKYISENFVKKVAFQNNITYNEGN